MLGEIVDYEDYDYREFWSGKKRSYEHLSEIYALKNLFLRKGKDLLILVEGMVDSQV
ncbi:unnamed protein product, partial [marine sediment metagenome]